MVNHLKPENSLLAKRPDLCKEWDYAKNKELTPDKVREFSNKKAYWKCPNGHSYPTQISHRTAMKSGCPYCSGNKVSEKNCLAIKFPHIAKEWDFVLNKKLTPNDVSFGSHKRVCWKCPNGHNYSEIIKNRTLMHSNCSYCSSLLFKNPELSKEWDYIKNKKLTPDGVGEFSNKQVWWKCKNGCSFKSIIADRSNGGGCHYCSKTYKRVSIDNCLASLYPSLVSEWHPTKNGKLTPYNVIGGSRKKVWWKCKINPEHEWPAILASRSVMGTNCPYCNGVLLKDDTLCASQAEAIKYIEYKEKGLIFKHNKPYHKSFGKRRYDFYFPEENKYVEVTSFNKTWYSKKPGIYFNYLRKIVKKRRFVKNILKAKFEFIKFVPTKEQKKKLKEWIK